MYAWQSWLSNNTRQGIFLLFQVLRIPHPPNSQATPRLPPSTHHQLNTEATRVPRDQQLTFHVVNSCPSTWSTADLSCGQQLTFHVVNSCLSRGQQLPFNVVNSWPSTWWWRSSTTAVKNFAINQSLFTIPTFKSYSRGGFTVPTTSVQLWMSTICEKIDLEWCCEILFNPCDEQLGALPELPWMAAIAVIIRDQKMA